MTVGREWNSELLFYKNAWWAASASVKHASQAERGCLHFHVTALLAAACAVEGFANYLISIVSPEIWSQERKFFAGNIPFIGTKGKLQWIALQCGLDAPDMLGYASVSQLLAMRDYLAHRRPTQFAFWRDDRISPEPSTLPSDARDLEARIRLLTCTQTLQEIESFAQTLVSGLTRLALPIGQRLRLLRLQVEPLGEQRISLQ